jgi:hypothetical protein
LNEETTLDLIQQQPGGHIKTDPYVIWNTVESNIIHNEEAPQDYNRKIVVVCEEMVCMVSGSNPDGRANDMLKLKE